MEIRTHREIDREISGAPVEVGENFARVILETKPFMAADERGLVHGGFLFSAADYAAMLSVNHPNVVLGEARVRFLKPVRVGEAVEFVARGSGEGKKRSVEVVGYRNGEEVFKGEFVCFVPSRHVLDRE